VPKMPGAAIHSAFSAPLTRAFAAGSSWSGTHWTVAPERRRRTVAARDAEPSRAGQLTLAVRTQSADFVVEGGSLLKDECHDCSDVIGASTSTSENTTREPSPRHASVCGCCPIGR
jgi:hypothetical protein